MTFSSALISFFIHATEDEDRVLETVSKTFSISHEYFERSKLEGHHKNPIKIYKAHLIGDEADRFVKNLLSKLKIDEKESIRQNLSMYVNRHGALFLRISKQDLFEDLIVLCQEDPIHIKLKPKFRHRPRNILSLYEELLSQG